MIKSLPLLLLTLALACGTTASVGPIEVDGAAADQETEARRIAQNKPDDARAVAQLGAVLVELGRSDEAIRTLGRAASLAPNDAEIARWQGRALLDGDRPVEAFRAYARALEANPEWRDDFDREVAPKILLRLSTQLLKDRRIVRDIAALLVGLSPAAAQNSGEPGARVLEAAASHRVGAGNHNEAIALYRLAQATGHSAPDSLFDLARAQLGLRLVDQAAESLEVWAAAGDNARGDRYQRGGALLEERFAFEAAERFYKKALEATPGDRKVELRRATVLFKAKRAAEADAILAPLIAGGATGPELLEIGQVALRFSSTRLASDAFAKAVSQSPDDVGLWTVAVRALSEAGRKGEVERIIGLPDRHASWGDAYLELREPAKALARYELASKGSDPPADLRLRMARALHQLGKAELRDQSTAAFVAAATDRSAALAKVAAFYESISEPKRALASYQSAVALQPADRTSAFALAKVSRDLRDPIAERAALERWASQAAVGPPRAAAWLDVSEYWSLARKGAEAADALDKALAQGDTPSRRPALLAQATVQLRLLSGAVRSEQLFRAWIDAAPEKDRLAARQEIVKRIAADLPLARFRNRLLEDIVQADPDPAGFLELGKAYLSVRPPQREAAERAFARYIETAGDKQSAVLDVGERLEESNALSEAARIYARLQPADVTEPDRLLGIARVHLRSGGAVQARPWTEAYLLAVESPGRSARDDLFRAATQYVNAGIWETAVRIFRALLPGDANRIRILKPLGDALLGMGDEAGADEVFRSYIDASGRSLQAVLTVGDAFRQKRYYARARIYYESVFDERSKARLPRLFPTLFETYVKLGLKEELKNLARRYVALTPSPRAYADAARRLREAGLLREAFDLYGEAARSQPNATQYREQQATIALQLGDVDGARQAVDTLLGADRTPATWLRASLLFAQRGHDDVAASILDRAAELGVRSGALHLERGRLHLRGKRIAQAKDEFVAAIGSSEELNTVLGGIRASLVSAALFADYADVLRRVAAEYPSRDETWLELGDSALAAGDLDLARQHWARFVERDSRGALLVAGRLWRAGDVTEARRHYERALSSPTLDKRLEVLTSLVSALLTTGLPERVPAALDRFAALGADGELDPTRLAPLLEEAGYLTEATDAYEELTRNRPVPTAFYHLGKLRLLANDPIGAAVSFGEFLATGAGPAERIAGADRGKIAAVHLERLAVVVDAWLAAGRIAEALELLDRQAISHADLGAIHLLRARLLLAEGQVLEGLDALGSMVEAPVGLGITDSAVAPLIDQITLLGRDAEGLEILLRTSADTRGRALGAAVVGLALRVGDAASVAAEIADITSGTDGMRRLALGQLLVESGRITEATEMWLGALEPGQGLMAIDGSIRGLLALSRRGAEGLAEEVDSRIARLVEERQEQHRILGQAAFDVGLDEMAADHAQAWIDALAAPPPIDAFLDPRLSHPWRLLIDAQLRLNRPDAAFESLERYSRDGDDPKRTFALGALLFESRLRFDLSARASRRGLEHDPLDVGLRFGVIRLALLEADSSTANSAAEMLTRDGGGVQIHGERLSALFAAHGKLDDAAGWIEKVRPRGPMFEWLKALSDTTRTADLRSWVDRGIASSPDPDFAAVRLCAFGIVRRGFPVDLLRELSQRVITGRPDAPHPVAFLAAAVSLLGSGDEGAEKALGAALNRGGADVGAVLNLDRGASSAREARLSTLGIFADRAIGAGRMALALRTLQRLAELGGPTQGHLAVADVVRKALDLYPALPEAHRHALAARALAGIEPLRRSGQLVADLIAVASELYEKQGDPGAAAFVYRDAIQRFPGDPGLRNNLAYLLARRGESLEEALGLVRSALLLSPAGSLAYLDTEAWILHRLGRNDEALEKMQASLRHVTGGEMPALSESYYHLGRILQALKRDDEANRAFRRAERLDPDGPFGQSAKQALAE